jgi:hypothetical protein
MSEQRPVELTGPTVHFEFEETPMYITLNFCNGKPFEVFIRYDEVKVFEWVTTVTILITRMLRDGISIETIAGEMMEICSPHSSHFYKGKQYPSLAAHIGHVLKELGELGVK